MPKKRIVLTLGAAILLISGCHRDLECPSSNDLRALDLRGRWIVEITPDSAIQLPSVRLGHALTGKLELTSRDSSRTGVIYTGVYNVDFQSVGLFKKSEQVLAYTPAGDTLHIVLNPNVDHGNIELTARCRTDGMRGQWRTNGDPSGASGHFTLHQMENE